MKLRHFPLLTDQNIHSEVSAFLRGEGYRVLDILQASLVSASDTAILAHATAEGRVVITHDADFGMLAIQQGLPFVGIVYLRPGHVGAKPTIESMQQILHADPELKPPFILVAKRIGNRVNIRVRSLAPPTDSDDTIP